MRRLPRKEGAGDTGCALHPRSRVQIVRRNRTRAYRFSGNTPASPAQWLYGLWRDLPGDEFLFVTVAAGLRQKRPGWIASATDGLTSATDARTTRFCRTQPDFAKRSAGCPLPDEEPYEAGFSAVRLHTGRSLTETRPATASRADAAASTASPPAHRDDRDPPLLSGETGGVVKVICPTEQREYFFAKGWTGFW